MLILTGPSFQGISSPLGSFRVGDTSYSTYRLVLGAVAVVLLILLYILFMRTKFGLRSRATIQNPGVAQAMGVDTARMYTLTFALGSAFAGLTGGLYAPTTAIVPQFGSGFIVEAFVTVIVGGGNVLLGTSVAGILLGAIYAFLAQTWGTYIARVGLLVATMIVIRVLPKGISGLIDRWQLRPRGLK
jgi:branched-chain amino acid transport system permease protein